MARERKKGILFLKAQAERTVLEEPWLPVSPSFASPRLGCKKSKREVHPSPGRNEPTGALRANEAKALSQRQRAKELMCCRGRRSVLRGKKSHVGCLPTLLDSPQPTRDLCPDPQQAPGEPPDTGLPLASLPSAEHTMSPKCSLTAGKEYTGASPDPPNMENQGPRAPGYSGNGGSLVRPSMRPSHR